jgi:hypothetical protein
MKKAFAWTTPKGAKIEATITVEHITRKIVDADGDKVEVSCDEWFRNVEAITVNGKETEMRNLWQKDGRQIIVIGKRGNDYLMVVVPSDVEEYLYSGEREQQRQERIAALEKRKDAAEEQMVDGKLPTSTEAKAKQIIWNNVMNEGGEGYVPYWYSQEQYDQLCESLQKLKKKG